MGLGLKGPAALPFKIMDKVVMLIREVDIGLKPEPFPPIIQVSLVDFWVLLKLFMRYFDMSLIPATFLHITKVVYIPRGGWGENIQNIHQGCVLYLHQNYTYYSYTSMPPHSHPSTPPQPIFFHIALLFLFMNLMELCTIPVYNP